MDELESLIQNSTENSYDNDVAAALADSLQDRGNTAGVIIKKALESPRSKVRVPYLPFSYTGSDATKRVVRHTTDGQDGRRMEVELGWQGRSHQGSAVPQHGDDLFGVVRLAGAHRDHGREFPTLLSHEEARNIADGLPNAKEAHEFLNKHAGPDPRTQKFARKYDLALKCSKSWQTRVSNRR